MQLKKPSRCYSVSRPLAIRFMASSKASPLCDRIIYQLADDGKTVRVAAVRHRGVAYRGDPR
jgi:hypothetical protein